VLGSIETDGLSIEELNVLRENVFK
ncbi:hypothetical protein BMETH_2840173729, partial [methanotrophic bacterial endosymbiont of Bathymodiolus sp.]